MAIIPISGTDSLRFIGGDTIPDNTEVVVAVNPDGSVIGGGGSQASPTIVGGEYNSTLPTLTNGQTDALQLDNAGNLRTLATASTITGSDGLANTTLTSFLARAETSLAAPRPMVSAGYLFNGTTWDRARGDTTGAYVVQKGTATVANGQISVATTNTQIVAARTGRGRVTITNLGTTDVFIGATGVTTTTGQLLAGTKGASITLHTSAAIFGIVGTGNQSVSYIEEY